jgi:phosphate transport system protein
MQNQIARVSQRMVELTGLVQSAVAEAVQAVVQRDAPRAQRVIDGDIAIDKAEVDIEEDCLKLLALYQPVAADLRFIVAVLKINDDIERVGDLAANTAERALFLCEQPPIAPPGDLSEMSGVVLSMLSGSLEALMHQDVQRARLVRVMDDQVDALNREMHVKIRAAVKQHPEQVDQLLSYLSVSRYLERVADCATNVAEDVIYLVEGEIVRHKPPGPGS